MSLRTLQTRIITQPPPGTPTSPILSYIVASFRVYNSADPVSPVQAGSVALSAAENAAAQVSPSDSGVVFVIDSQLSSNLYAVSVASPYSPVILDSVAL
jgi:hypothetical protein